MKLRCPEVYYLPRCSRSCNSTQQYTFTVTEMSDSLISKTTENENDKNADITERNESTKGQNYLSHTLVIKLGTDKEIRILENQIKELKGKSVHDKLLLKEKHQVKQNELCTAIESVPKPNVSYQVKKRIALVAHDRLKQRMVDWCKQWHEELGQHQLMGTGKTARKIFEETSLPVEIMHSGPLGGDQQIGARISEQKCDILIFFWDPLTAMPHDSDVKALLRIASLYNVAVAINSTTADMIISNMHQS